MGALLLGVGGLIAAGVAFVASRPASTPAPAPQPQPVPAPPPVTPPPSTATAPSSPPQSRQTRGLQLEQFAGKAKDIFSVGAGGATLLGPGTAGAAGAGTVVAGTAATAALVAATAGLGVVITGDAAGAPGGVVLLVAQAAGNKGAGIIQAQAGNVGRVVGRELDSLFNGPLGNAGTSTLYQAAGFLTGAVLSMGGIAALPVVGQLALLVVGIGQAISEQNQLAYGQAGATRDTIAEARGFYDRTLSALRAAYLAKYFGTLQGDDDNRMKTIAANLAIGWAHEVQDSRGRVLNSAPGPLFIAPGPARNQWAWDRGLLVRDMGPVVNALVALSGHTPDVDGFAAQVRGRELANFGHYLKARLEPRGIGLTHRGHLEYWRARGAFRCDELYAEGDAFTSPASSNDSIRLGSTWFLGADSHRDSALRTVAA